MNRDQVAEQLRSRGFRVTVQPDPADTQARERVRAGSALYQQRHRVEQDPDPADPTEPTAPAGSLAAGAQLYRSLHRGVLIEPASEPDNFGPEAA